MVFGFVPENSRSFIAATDRLAVVGILSGQMRLPLASWW